MKKTIFYLFILFGLSVFQMNAQTSPINETFSNLGPYGGYQTETWTGDDGGTWTATDARTDRSISGAAIMVRNGELTSPSVAGGIGSLTVTTQRQFGGGSGNMDLIVNGTSVGSIPYDGTVQTTTINGINVSGNVTVVIDATNSSSDRVVIDDLQWTAYAAGSPLLVSDEITISNLDYEIGSGPSSSQSFNLSGSDLDNSDVTVSVPVSSDFEIAETTTGTYSNSITLASFDGTATDIFVRLKSGLSINSYSDNITVTGGGASDITVGLEGEVSPEPYDNEETFANYPETSGSYEDGGFLGLAGNTWNYLAARGDINIDSETVTLRNNSSSSLNSNINGGISIFEFDYLQAFSTDVNLEVYVNGSLVTTVTSSSEQGVTKNSGQITVNEPGSFTIEFKQASGGGQVAIDNLKWNSFAITPDYTYESGTWSPSNPVGFSTATDNILIVDGSIDVTGTLVANNLEVASGATLNVTSSGILDLAGDITNNGSLTFQSDASGSGQLANFSGSITGDITTERYIPAKRAFRLISSAVDGSTIANAWQQDTHITGAGGATNGFDATNTDNPSMFTFDNTITDQSSGAGWQAVTSTTDVISAGTPYRLMVRGDRTIDLADNEAPATATTLSASGTMHTGSYSPTLATAANNYSFVGNPYQAVVDFGAVTKSNLTDFIYVWDASIAGSNGNGGYITVQISTGNITAPSPSSSDASQYIAPGQAFFVQNNASGNGSITFEEADKATGQAQVSIFSTYTNFYINSRLYKASALQNGEMESDAIGLRFNENYTTIGSDEDASKLANPGENYAIVNNGFKSIDKQNIPTDGHQVDLLMMNYEDTAYSLSFNLGNQPETLKVYLNDSYLNTQTELTESTTYDFTVDANVPESIDQNRFHLSFEEVPLNNQSFDAGQVRLYPNPVVHQLQIELPASVEINSVQVFNTLGQQVLTTTQSQVDVSQLASGVYVVELETTKGKVSKKIIKQ
ncbi:T9SS type A sorting domain-containing protein [Psychroflexus sp. ALD_RP9]|uniref:T9SS type A sorting domain-containing protein n=1 Tax=Psychroflexus sp. ALD_RP9 TaxID=2777186 RepID=UPI001A8ED6F6|nr:T9SS type A sorting domain-containing protein [Psychroflexus sp. ALD_RP9]QSS96239.1 T9SS type A sorting domain-containing protein [Psychroflexus sp. ALD_RP9]